MGEEGRGRRVSGGRVVKGNQWIIKLWVVLSSVHVVCLWWCLCVCCDGVQRGQQQPLSSGIVTSVGIATVPVDPVALPLRGIV